MVIASCTKTSMFSMEWVKLEVVCDTQFGNQLKLKPKHARSVP